MQKIKQMWNNKGLLDFLNIIQGYSELGCSSNESIPFIARGLYDVNRGAHEKFVLSWHDDHTHAIVALYFYCRYY